MRNRRDRRDPNKIVVHATNRTVTGLPFIPGILFDCIIKGILARGQELHPAQVNHFLWMENHFHIILSGRAKHISPFMNYVGGEVAKYLKRLYPNKFQTKVWQGRFKEQRIYSAESLLEKIAYLYANPVRANLVEKCSEWPGASSLKMYKAGSLSFDARWIRPSKISKVKKTFYAGSNAELLKELKSLSSSVHTFTISPDSWKKCFDESRDWSSDHIYNRLLERLAKIEQEEQIIRGGKRVTGLRLLKSRKHWKNYKSKKTGRTPYLECHGREKRKELIVSYKEFCNQCREAFLRWKKGIFDVIFPVGAYRPGVGSVLFQPALIN